MRLELKRSSIIIAGAIASVATVSSLAGAQAGPPGTDIFLAPLSVVGSKVTVGAPTNITARQGYDNQPSFTPDGTSILFTSVRAGGQSDIYRYDLASKRTSQVTHTPESEYSPTVMPGGTRFSVIRVEKDSAQRLWSFALDGSDPRVMVPNLKPVGYHTWLDDGTLAMFVLGNPNALVHGDPATGLVDTLARRIGRSLARIPGTHAFSYSQTVDSATWLQSRNARDTASERIVQLPRGVQDIAWITRDLILCGVGSTLQVWRRGKDGWSVVADFGTAGPKRITRLAISPDGHCIALVADDGA